MWQVKVTSGKARLETRSRLSGSESGTYVVTQVDRRMFEKQSTGQDGSVQGGNQTVFHKSSKKGLF